MNAPDVVGIVVARGGSKGLPRKNIIDLAGKPMIAWTIEAALSSTLSRVIVSTDCPEIADVSRKRGAEVPFLRPSELSQDDTHVSEVMRHAINWLAAESGMPDYAVLLQATSPLRIGEDINRVVELAVSKGAHAAVSVAPAEPHPYLSQIIGDEETLSPVFGHEKSKIRRQLMPEMWALNGAVYVVDAAQFLETGRFCPPGALAYKMPSERSLDVDSNLDLLLVKTLLDARNDEI